MALRGQSGKVGPECRRPQQLNIPIALWSRLNWFLYWSRNRSIGLLRVVITLTWGSVWHLVACVKVAIKL